MEKVLEKEKLVKIITHEFYCDSCGKKIGKSIEFDDGYYEQLNEVVFVIQNRYGSNRYSKKLHLCDTCRPLEVEAFKGRYKAFCESLGLTKDNEYD